MLLLYIVIFLILLMFLFAWFFYRKAFHRPPAKDLTDENTLLTSEWFSYTPVLKPALEWFGKQPWEEIGMQAADGCPLQALWCPGKSGKACLVMMHGYGALPQHLSVVARWASKQGWSLLIPYERSHGKSGGESCTLGLLEASDCRLWAEKASELSGGDKLILFGGGMGGFAVLHALSGALPPSVCAVVADGAYASPREMLRRVMKEEMRMRVFPLLQIVCLFARIR